MANNCRKCGKSTIGKLLYCDVRCRTAFHTVQHSRRKGVLSRRDTIALLGEAVCKFEACGKVFRPSTFGQTYCSARCRDNEGYRVRPKKTFVQKLKWEHSLTFDEYIRMYDAGCAVCKEEFDPSIRELIPCIDHDHRCCRKGKSCGKCRRGLVHSRCNLIMGHAKDNSVLLRQAASYLEEHEKVQM